MVQSTSRGAKYPIKAVRRSLSPLLLLRRSLAPAFGEVITSGPACKFNSRRHLMDEGEDEGIYYYCYY